MTLNLPPTHARASRFVLQPAISTEFFLYGEVWGVVWVEMGVNPVRPPSDPTRSHNLGGGRGREGTQTTKRIRISLFPPSPLLTPAPRGRYTGKGISPCELHAIMHILLNSLLFALG